jgi:hypothetical protein
MSVPEKVITELESEFPTLAGGAFATARSEALASGQSVVQSEDGVIYEVFPNGARRELKRIEPPTQILAGTKVMIR